MFDIVIRGGTLVDGSGSAPVQCDVAIAGDRIAYVGPNASAGKQEIDASGLVVTPGFIDLHTHYDAQVMWDPVLAPSSLHGVTTVVIGNCGVGFAPVRPEQHEWLMTVMENIEEIPVAAMKAGLAWDWESFPEYLDALGRRRHTLDIGAQVPHIALRGYVMGERADRDEPASPDDIREMTRLLRQALEAGALGFSCSRTTGHVMSDGRKVPGSFADRDELTALCKAIGQAGHGHVQYLGSMSEEVDENYDWMASVSRDNHASVHFLLSDLDWQARLARIEAANRDGASLVGHVAPRPIANSLQWQSARHPFMARPSVRAMAHLPWAEQLARLADPAFRAQVLSEPNDLRPDEPAYMQLVFTAFERMFELGDDPCYEPDPATDSIAARAAALGIEPQELAYEIMMRHDGCGQIYLVIGNYRAGNLDEIGQLLAHESTVVSLSDGGAHCSRIVDASAPTFLLTHWARDRKRGETMSLQQAVKAYSHDTATAYGLNDRGLVREGYLADLNVIDFAHLRLHAPYMTHDLPGGGKRLMQKADGYVATIKRGCVTFRNGEHTGAHPGQVIRGPQVDPAGTSGN